MPTRLIAVQSCMEEQQQPTQLQRMHSPLLHSAGRISWRVSSMWLCVLLLLSSACSSPLLLQVSAARARASSTPHLLHVQAQTLQLQSRLISTAGASEELHQSAEQLVLLQLYFDRALPQHTLPADLLQQPVHDRLIAGVSCAGVAAELQGWTLPSGTLRWNVSAGALDPSARILALVSPVEGWMEHFEAEQSLDEEEEEEEDNSSSGNLFLPTGALSSSSAPFAANAFAMLIRMRGARSGDSALLDLAQLQSCSLRLRLDKLLPATDKTVAPEQLIEVPLAARKAPAAAAVPRSRRSRKGQPDQFGVSWPSPLQSQRWIMPAHLPGGFAEVNTTAPSSDQSPKLPKTCASLREEQRLVFLEDGVSSVGAMLGPIVSTMMAPVTEQFEELSTIQVAQQLSKNYVSSLTGSIPPEVSTAVSASLETGVTDMTVDLLTTSLTASCSVDIANTLGAYLTRSVSGVVGDSVHDHLLASLTALIPPDLSTRLAISVTKVLPEIIIRDVSMSLTHTLVGSLTRGLSGFNHMQKMCRSCKLYGTRCSDCKYVQEVAKSTSSYSAQYSHYYSQYYSQYYAPIAAQLENIAELAKPYTPEVAKDEEDFGRGGPQFPPEGEEGDGAAAAEGAAEAGASEDAAAGAAEGAGAAEEGGGEGASEIAGGEEASR